MLDETRKGFHEELDAIRVDIVQIAARVTEMLPRATRALLDHDLAEAQRLIDEDDEIDARTIVAEEACLRLLALQQPMAGDLRSIIATLWISAELERSADLVVNICKANRRMFGVTFSPEVRGLIGQMSEEALRLTRLAIDAYDELDEGLAGALDDIDDRLDDLHSEYIQALFRSHEDHTLDLQPAVQMALIGRYYERIGDHAVNVGERTRYMVTGWMPESAGRARLEARASLGSEADSDEIVSLDDTDVSTADDPPSG